jgi:hypothetical protein
MKKRKLRNAAPGCATQKADLPGRKGGILQALAGAPRESSTAVEAWNPAWMKALLPQSSIK